MKYNEKYDRWVTKGGLVYRYDSKQDKLVLCKQSKLRNGYLRTSIKGMPNTNLVHRMVWETFKGPIPFGKVIDHINTVKTDNRLENLRCVSQRENENNPLTREHLSKSLKGKHKPKGVIKSEFGRKFKEHYGFTRTENIRLYLTEHQWYRTHNRKCRWEE